MDLTDEGKGLGVRTQSNGMGRKLLPAGRGSYSATVISPEPGDTSIADLIQSPRPVRSSTYNSKFFLASISDKGWLPHVCIVRHRDTIVGVVHAKERKLGRLRTGLIYADGTLDNLVIAEPVHREPVLMSAMSCLLRSPRVHGLRLLIRPGEYESAVIEKVASSTSLELSWARAENHTVLPLAGSYDQFLGRLGYRTRRNFRYYRRRFEAAGHRYIEELTLEELKRVAFQLVGKSVFGADVDGVARAVNMLSAVERPLLVGLRARDGEWLSILGGWSEAERTTIFMQMNNERDYGDYSLSLVLRGYVIEMLIRNRVRELVFWAGVGEPLCRYTHPIPAVAAYLDKPTFGWRTFRALLNSTRAFLPARTAWMTEWISPSAPHEL